MVRFRSQRSANIPATGPSSTGGTVEHSTVSAAATVEPVIAYTRYSRPIVRIQSPDRETSPAHSTSRRSRSRASSRNDALTAAPAPGPRTA